MPACANNTDVPGAWIASGSLAIISAMVLACNRATAMGSFPIESGSWTSTVAHRIVRPRDTVALAAIKVIEQWMQAVLDEHNRPPSQLGFRYASFM